MAFFFTTGANTSSMTQTLKSQKPVRSRLAAVVAMAFVLAACGSTEDSATDSTTQDTVVTAETEADESEGEDHEDEDHTDVDEDHGDEDHDDDHDDDDQDESGGLGAHEHGSAELAVAWIDSDVVIDLISPTQNVFGFEYEPETEEDLAIAAERTEALTTAGLVTVNESADCELTEPASTEIEREASHSEITVSWAFSCANPEEVAEVDLTALFTEFPGFVDIDAEWISATSQSSSELSPQQPTLSLES